MNKEPQLPILKAIKWSPNIKNKFIVFSSLNSSHHINPKTVKFVYDASFTGNGKLKRAKNWCILKDKNVALEINIKLLYPEKYKEIFEDFKEIEKYQIEYKSWKAKNDVKKEKK